MASSPEVKTVLGHHMVVGIKDLTLLFSQGYQSINEQNVCFLIKILSKLIQAK